MESRLLPARATRIRNIAHVIAPIALIITAAAGGAGCGKSDSASDGTGSEIAVAAIGGSASKSEGSIAFNQINPRSEPSYLARFESALSPVRSAWAVPSCKWSSILSSCSSNAQTLSFDGCSALIDPAIKISGSETFTWTGDGCCNSDPLAASSATPCSFTRRTINAAGAADPLVRSLGSHSVTLNTEDSSGFATAKTGGFTVTCLGSDGVQTCDAQRSVTIQGAHYTGHSGRADWDHTVSTDAPIVMQGHGASRKVLSGTIHTQHNVAKYTTISKVKETLTFSANCCYPTGGSIETTFSGGDFDGKTETMTFGTTCGEATLTDTVEKKTGLTLRHCL